MIIDINLIITNFNNISYKDINLIKNNCKQINVNISEDSINKIINIIKSYNINTNNVTIKNYNTVSSIDGDQVENHINKVINMIKDHDDTKTINDIINTTSCTTINKAIENNNKINAEQVLTSKRRGRTVYQHKNIFIRSKN